MSEQSADGFNVSADAFAQWCEVCTIGRCSAEHARQLAQFGRMRLRSALKMFGAQSLAEEYAGMVVSSASNSRAWLLMESHLYAGRGPRQEEPGGKSYKQSMLDKIGSAVEFEKYVTMTFKTVARQLACQEDETLRNSRGEVVWHRHRPNNADGEEMDLDTIVFTAIIEALGSEPEADGDGGDPEASALWDVEPLADDDEVFIMAVAARQAEALWTALERRERTLLCLLAAERPFPAIVRSGLLECKQSQCYSAAGALRAKVREALGHCDGVDDEELAVCRGLLQAGFAKAAKAISAKWAALPENEAVRRFIESDEA